MKIFDVHTHVYPDKIAVAVLKKLREQSQDIPTFTEGTASDLEAKAQAAGYLGMLNCPVVTNAHQMMSVNDWVAKLNAWPHLSLGGIFPEAPNVVAEIERIQSLGLLGLKFHPEYQNFYVLDEKMAPVWEYCSAHDFPVLFHAGSDIGFPGGRHSKPGDFAVLARKYPRLTIICAHMGGWNNWDEVEADLAGSPVYLDTSFSKQWMRDPRQFERIIRKHGVGRVLFGSDSPWSKLEYAIAEVRETGLTDSEKQQIFWDNADRLFNLTVRAQAAGAAI